MGGQPAPIEPATKQLDKPGGETRDTYNQPSSGADGASSSRPPDEVDPTELPSAVEALVKAPQFVEERFCISDDTCVDYSGTDYICVAGKCVPMGGQPAPIEPATKQLDKPGGETRDTQNTPSSGNDGA